MDDNVTESVFEDPIETQIAAVIHADKNKTSKTLSVSVDLHSLDVWFTLTVDHKFVDTYKSLPSALDAFNAE